LQTQTAKPEKMAFRVQFLASHFRNRAQCSPASILPGVYDEKITRTREIRDTIKAKSKNGAPKFAI
jgi:hypothetical protein